MVRDRQEVRRGQRDPHPGVGDAEQARRRGRRPRSRGTRAATPWPCDAPAPSRTISASWSRVSGSSRMPQRDAHHAARRGRRCPGASSCAIDVAGSNGQAHRRDEQRLAVVVVAAYDVGRDARGGRDALDRGVEVAAAGVGGPGGVEHLPGDVVGRWSSRPPPAVPAPTPAAREVAAGEGERLARGRPRARRGRAPCGWRSRRRPGRRSRAAPSPLQQLGARLVAATGHEVLVAGRARAVGEVHVHEPLAEVARHLERVGPGHRGVRQVERGVEVVVVAHVPARAGRPRTPATPPSTGTCSRRRTGRRSRSPWPRCRRRSRGRSRAASGTAGARRRSRRRAARPRPGRAAAWATARCPRPAG